MVLDTAPLVMFSRIEYQTDMTTPGTPIIDLGRVLEVVLPAKGRFFGLAGRTQLEPSELALVHDHSSAELNAPWDFMLREFDSAWEQPAGKSVLSLSNRFSWALRFTPPERIEISGLRPELEWIETIQVLQSFVERLKGELVTSAGLRQPKVVSLRPKKPVLSQGYERELEAA